MERSQKLHEYSTLIHYIRQNQHKGDTLAEAVNIAVDTCIREGVLEKFLRKNQGEVCRLLLTEFDEQKFLEQEREVWKDEGIEIGMERGMDSKLQELIQKKLVKGKSIDVIADELEEEVAIIQEIISGMDTPPAVE